MGSPLTRGDAALCVEFSHRIDPEINLRVPALDQALATMSLPGIVEMVPT
jgi:allophanate hydrolase subunit 1